MLHSVYSLAALVDYIRTLVSLMDPSDSISAITALPLFCRFDLCISIAM